MLVHLIMLYVLNMEACFRRGSARSMDHAQLVHSQWLHAAACNMRLHIVRVATDDNIADLPSRMVGSHVLPVLSYHTLVSHQDFELLKRMGAAECEPKLCEQYMSGDAWDVLQERWHL